MEDVNHRQFSKKTYGFPWTFPFPFPFPFIFEIFNINLLQTLINTHKKYFKYKGKGPRKTVGFLCFLCKEFTQDKLDKCLSSSMDI